MDYATFLQSKRLLGRDSGFDVSPDDLHSSLYPFQRHITRWALKKGQGAIFADCGLGKTLMELAWASEIAKRESKPVLIGTPLAVSYQIVREAEKFGIDGVIRNQTGECDTSARVIVTNYERLSMFNPVDFAGMVADESSILKNFDGVRRKEVTDFMGHVKYRLLATATAAPNDFTELGTSSEAIGDMGHIDMLSRFFTNRDMSIDQRRHARNVSSDDGWRLKGHAVTDFWRWVCSWAIACRKPSDLGFDDDRFVLPDLIEKNHFVKTESARDGWLFDTPACNLHEEREASRRTITERCEYVADLVDHADQALVWCNLNDEGNLLEELIPDAEQVSGSDSDEDKESKLIAFAKGDIGKLVTKPKIGAWGLNLQNCNHVTFFPTHSYEQYYQGVRRCWRFGQKRPVTVDNVGVDGVRNVMDNLSRKASAADEMFSQMVAHMRNSMAIDNAENFNERMEVPAWL